jgi:hypothetical protein
MPEVGQFSDAVDTGVEHRDYYNHVEGRELSYSGW